MQDVSYGFIQCFHAHCELRLHCSHQLRLGTTSVFVTVHWKLIAVHSVTGEVAIAELHLL